MTFLGPDIARKITAAQIKKAFEEGYDRSCTPTVERAWEESKAKEVYDKLKNSSDLNVRTQDNVENIRSGRPPLRPQSDGEAATLGYN